MLDKNTLVKVTNRDNGSVGYSIPDLGNLQRRFEAGETKEVTAEELRKLSYTIGGKVILDEYLIIHDKDLVAELLGEVVTDSTKKNLELRAEAEFGACDGKMMIARRAKELGLDAVHDTVHEMAKDEARHGRGFDGLLARYFA